MKKITLAAGLIIASGAAFSQPSPIAPLPPDTLLCNCRGIGIQMKGPYDQGQAPQQGGVPGASRNKHGSDQQPQFDSWINRLIWQFESYSYPTVR